MAEAVPSRESSHQLTRRETFSFEILVDYKIENYTSLKLENPKPVFFQEPSRCVCEDVLLYPVDK